MKKTVLTTIVLSVLTTSSFATQSQDYTTTLEDLKETVYHLIKEKKANSNINELNKQIKINEQKLLKLKNESIQIQNNNELLYLKKDNIDKYIKEYTEKNKNNIEKLSK
jgi:hypothetical protein